VFHSCGEVAMVMNCVTRTAHADAMDAMTCNPTDEKTVVDALLNEPPGQALERKFRDMEDTAPERLRIARLSFMFSRPNLTGEEHDWNPTYLLADKSLQESYLLQDQSSSLPMITAKKKLKILIRKTATRL
jgi:hypothetical protein